MGEIILKSGARSRTNGNDIVYDEENDMWFYEDGSPAEGPDGKEIPRPCPCCGKLPTPEGHDACLGELPGVKFACCGHGTRRGYITFTNGTIMRFRLEKIDKKKEKQNHGRK